MAVGAAALVDMLTDPAPAEVNVQSPTCPVAPYSAVSACVPAGLFDVQDVLPPTTASNVLYTPAPGPATATPIGLAFHRTAPVAVDTA